MYGRLSQAQKKCLVTEQTAEKYVRKLIFVNIPRSNPSDIHLQGENLELT